MTFQVMYEAVIKKDSQFDGLFYTCVKTTGIFCRPVCTARKPKKENIEFVDSIKSAINKGYRPCKICKPLNNSINYPKEINNLLNEFNSNPSIRISDQNLRERNLKPHTLRRWFIKKYGITFHEYQRMIRINTAFKNIKNGNTALEAALSSGFESLSGFNDSFKSVLGISPIKGKEYNLIDLTRIETPLGTMVACATNSGICLLEFSDRRMLETQFKRLSKYYNAVIVPGHNAHFSQLENELHEYFEGNRVDFDVKLDIKGTPFQELVWNELTKIPYGQIRSYGDQAVNIGKPSAVRAVANANGMNRISIIIPCHRVLGADGKMVGYGGGIWRKKKLLDIESINNHRHITF